MTTVLQSPTQAYDLFSQPKKMPRQRHVFLLRFQSTYAKLDNLTFAIKTVERPKINIKTEEMNQYNKKRQIYTGFKYEPIRMTFYDTADGAAQEMWKAYAKYYFGDFTPGMDAAFGYDVTSASLLANSDKLGLNAPVAGAAPNKANQSTDIGAQFYLHTISIYQFYDSTYDAYTLVNPRITMWEPDDMDYENASIATISMSLAFENVQYSKGALNNGLFPEFQQGGQPGSSFYGSPVPVSASNTNAGASPLASAVQSIGGYLAPAAATTTAVPAALSYRYGSPPSNGSLGVYGNFQFGITNPLSAAATSAVGSVLDSVQNAVSSATYDVTSAAANAISSGFGTVARTVASGMLAAGALSGGTIRVGPSGAQLPAQAYGAINAYQTGTAQYGYNPNTAADGSSWGYNGPDGYLGPVGQENNGPYSAYQPSGLDGRFADQSPIGGLY